VTTTPRLVKSLTQVNTSDAPVNPDSDDSQLDGQVAPLADGGYVVVWTDGSGTHNFSGTAIVGQRYDSLGNKVAGEVKISQFSSGDQSSPAITALPNGNVAIAFVDSFLGNQDLIVRIFGSGGASLNLVRTDFIATGPNQTFNPSITAFADGSYVITYTIGTGPETDIVARIVNPFGGWAFSSISTIKPTIGISPRSRRYPTATSWWSTRMSLTAAQPTRTSDMRSSLQPARRWWVPMSSRAAMALDRRPIPTSPRCARAASSSCGPMPTAP
jgi:hypothetical protein